VAGKWGTAAVLTGNPVGLGLDAPELLTRVIPLIVEGSDLTGTHAILARKSATSDSFQLIAPVTNSGNRLRCFVQADPLELLDTAGTVVYTRPGVFLKGQVGKLKSGSMHTGTCVGVGQTGYLLELLSRPAVESIASARITLTSSESEWETPIALVVPVSYDAPARDKPFTVTIVNQGPITARVSGLSRTIFFDATDTPAYWGYLYSGSSLSNSPHDLAVGDTYQLVASSSSEFWNGSSTKQLMLIDFGSQ
jgi:hypothetical protein